LVAPLWVIWAEAEIREQQRLAARLRAANLKRSGGIEGAHTQSANKGLAYSLAATASDIDDAMMSTAYCSDYGIGVVWKIVESCVHFFVRVICDCVAYRRDVVPEFFGKPNGRFNASVSY